MIFWMYFLRQSNKNKNKQMGLYQTKKLLHSKKRKTNKNTKGACTEWEKIFANDIFYTGIISKIYKEFIQLNIKKKLKMSRGPK